GTSIDAYLTMLDADGWAAIDSTATTRTLHRVLSTSVRRAADAGPLTRAVLGVVAVLDDDDIPRSLFTDGCAAIDELASATPTDIDEAIAGLERLSLIEVDGTDVHAHHLTQEVAAAAFGRPDLAVALLNAAVSTVDDASLRDVWQPLVPHAIALLERIDESGEPTTTAARLARALSTHLSGRGFYFSAFDHMELATSWLEQLVDTADGELVSARAELSTCCSQIGAHGEALELARQVLELRERIGGPDHLDTLRAVNNLAVRNLELGRYAEALPLAHRAIDGLEATVGADDPNTLTARGNLSIIATQMGDHDTAIEVATSVVDTRVQLLGPAHLDTVRARNNLSVCLSAAGRLTAALEVIEEAMGAMEVALGGDHPETVTVRYNLSICHRQLGDVDNAIRLAERVVHDRERLLGSEHPDTIRARDNLSNCHGRVGNYVSAFFLSKRALFDGVQVLGLHHPDTVAMREWNQHIAKQLKRRRRPQRLLSALSRSAHT
ncbi:MAG: tetratricopeptide repeat protein, partial [Actinomycetota bacterium]|nr:tetratricopeptide repeat protein [Actinomycetota bacterium]